MKPLFRVLCVVAVETERRDGPGTPVGPASWRDVVDLVRPETPGEAVVPAMRLIEGDNVGMEVVRGTRGDGRTVRGVIVVERLSRSVPADFWLECDTLVDAEASDGVGEAMVDRDVGREKPPNSDNGDIGTADAWT